MNLLRMTHKACLGYLLSKKDKYPLCRLLDETCLEVVSREKLHNGIFHSIKFVQCYSDPELTSLSI